MLSIKFWSRVGNAQYTSFYIGCSFFIGCSWLFRFNRSRLLVFQHRIIWPMLGTGLRLCQNKVVICSKWCSLGLTSVENSPKFYKNSSQKHCSTFRLWHQGVEKCCCLLLRRGGFSFFQRTMRLYTTGYHVKILLRFRSHFRFLWLKCCGHMCHRLTYTVAFVEQTMQCWPPGFLRQ